MNTNAEYHIKRERLLKVIADELRDLPPLPVVVMRVLQSVNDPSTSANDLAGLISSDQVLSSQILRLANSAYYGFSMRITTVSHAVVILGLDTVRNLATAVSVKNAFMAVRSTALEREKFWEHSVAASICSQTIARRRRLAQSMIEEVFIGGLLHDIGRLFLQ